MNNKWNSELVWNINSERLPINMSEMNIICRGLAASFYGQDYKVGRDVKAAPTFWISIETIGTIGTLQNWAGNAEIRTQPMLLSVSRNPSLPTSGEESEDGDSYYRYVKPCVFSLVGAALIIWGCWSLILSRR